MSLRAMHEVSKQRSVQESSSQLIEEQRQTIEQQKQTISELSSQISLLKSEMQKLADKNAQLNEADEVQEIQKENAELKKQNEQLKQVCADTGEMISNFKKETEKLQKQKKLLIGVVNTLMEKCMGVTAETQDIQTKKSLFGRVKGLTWERWQRILNAVIALGATVQACNRTLKAQPKAAVTTSDQIVKTNTNAAHTGIQEDIQMTYDVATGAAQAQGTYQDTIVYTATTL